ncbi:MAG TPA: hypothetical protein VGR87_01065 [Candidatus Limnocylindria bacterium]|jgi:hypothetical protein|nr:hypothetical protein [Candidatus Limnocylindria bacterium]
MSARIGPLQQEIDRLTADLRVFDIVGIERAAWGWDRHEAQGLDGYHKAEKAALAFIERADLGPRWEDLRRQLFGLTESRVSLIAWQAKHGPVGHKAESAAFGAALGLFARSGVSHEQYVALVEPMAEALPWLLTERAPAPRE